MEEIIDNLPTLRTSTDAEDKEYYGRDWTRFWKPDPCAVAFPESTEEVADLVAWARQNGTALVPSGGRTGLSGGAVASRQEMVVSLERMRGLVEMDEADASLTVQAGMTVGEVQRRAVEAGLYYPVDWAAAESSQVGGSIATNAGGIRVLRYGMTRDWVRGLKVVTGTGEVLELNRGLIKNNSGYDLRHLFVGSEGTLGLITEATLGLAPPPAGQSVLLLGFASLEAVMPVFSLLRQRLGLSAFEFFDRASLEQVAEHTGNPLPLETECPFHAIVEFDDADGSCQDAALEAFEAAVESEWVVDGVISQSQAQAEELWQWREAISEAIAPRTPYKNDLSVRVSRVPEFLTDLDRLVEAGYPDFQVIWFGHIGDGNLHMNVLKPESWSVEDFHQACSGLSEKVFEVVRQHGGSLSAEHGVGLLKRDYLGMCRSEAEIRLMREIKRAFDPDGILNPGKLLP